MLGSNLWSLHYNLAESNPFLYRGYYYDRETGFYYLRSRYYDPVIGRFINADSHVNANGDLLGYNMYAYCSNNPVMNVDPGGDGFLSDIWDAIAQFFSNTFGAGCSETATVDVETPIIPDPSPITLATGESKTKTISERGDTSKPISVYANGDLFDFMASTVGIKINISDFTFELTLGFENIGFSGSMKTDNVTDSFGFRLNLSEFKAGFEASESIQYGDITTTYYSNFSFSGWLILCACYVLTGQSVSLTNTVATTN